jgi:hypothetical protein
MSRRDWATLYVSVPATLKQRMEQAAATDDRSLAKWIERLITDHFAREDAACELISPSSPHSTTSFSDSASSRAPS